MLANRGVCKFYMEENTTHGQTLEMLYLCVGGEGASKYVPLRSLTSILKSSVNYLGYVGVT